MAIQFRKVGTVNPEALLKTGMVVSDDGVLRSGKEPGFLSKVKTDLGNRFTNIGRSLSNSAKGEQTPVEGALQIVGQGAGAVGDVIGEGISSITPQSVKNIGVSILKTPLGQAGLEAIQGGVQKYDAWAKTNPRAAADLEAVVNIASLLPAYKGGQIATKGSINLSKNVVAKTTAIGEKIASSKAVEATTNIGKGLKETGISLAEGMKQLPERIGVNVAEKQATRQAIRNLPTKIAQESAQNGVGIDDIKFIYSIPKEEKKSLQKLFNITEKFSSDKTKPNPIQAVGNSITKRVKELESVKTNIGQKLGGVAEKLGVVTQEEVRPIIFQSLQKIPGLKGIKLTKSGKLDFNDTVLATGLTKSDRTAIQKVFNTAIKSGTGKQKHLLRQELFEILGGKKRSLQQLTDTQEKAFDAIRSGLSSVLESKNNQYKILSNSYREAVQPLQEIRKFMKNVAGANEDILDMQAGLLARRLTSNVQSNPQIRKILQTMDSTLKKNNKKVPISTERLQDFYNILDKYFDIAGGTTFQGQVQRGLEKASGLKDVVAEEVRSFAGVTDEVTRNALKKVILDALK